MTINVRVDIAARLVEVRPDPPLSDVGRAMEVLDETAKAARGIRRARIVLDLREARSTLGAGAVWLLAEALAKHAEAFAYRTAIVTAHEQVQYGDLFSLCARNRGFDVRSYDDYANALEWLMEPEAAEAARSSGGRGA